MKWACWGQGYTFGFVGARQVTVYRVVRLETSAASRRPGVVAGTWIYSRSSRGSGSVSEVAHSHLFVVS